MSDPMMERKAAAFDALIEACQRGGFVSGRTPEGEITEHLLDKVVENSRLRATVAGLREALRKIDNNRGSEDESAYVLYRKVVNSANIARTALADGGTQA